jgi:hypothetical protein
MSAQQLKYEDEVCIVTCSLRFLKAFQKPVIRSSKAIQPSKVKTAQGDQSDWHPTARIVFPATGDLVRLLEQNGTLKAITKLAIDLHLYEIAFKAGYEVTVSCPAESTPRP